MRELKSGLYSPSYLVKYFWVMKTSLLFWHIIYQILKYTVHHEKYIEKVLTFSFLISNSPY